MQQETSGWRPGAWNTEDPEESKLSPVTAGHQEGISVKDGGKNIFYITLCW